MTDIFWHLITCYNCGSQYKAPFFQEPDPEKTGECYDCATARIANLQVGLQLVQPTPIYKYFLTWTKKPGVAFERVQKNFQRFLDRLDVLRITLLWYTEEHLDSNAHIHCYFESQRTFPRSRISYYEKDGKIDKQKARGSRDEIRDYMSKENPINYYRNP